MQQAILYILLVLVIIQSIAIDILRKSRCDWKTRAEHYRNSRVRDFSLTDSERKALINRTTERNR